MAEDKAVDVLILGAGLSGLAAAFQLQKRAPHLTFLVAEANDRVGGRSLSIEVEGPQGQTDVLDLGGHWVCQRQKDIMNLIKELGGIEYYPQNITGTKVMQVGHNDPIRRYKTTIPSIGSVQGLIDMQRVINYMEDLVKQVDIRDPYASPMAKILDSKTMEELVRDVTDVPEVFDVFDAACESCLGCDLSHVSALFMLAYANAAGGMMNLLLVENQSAQEFRTKGGTQQFCIKIVNKIGQHRVLLNHAATKIEQKPHGGLVKVLFTNGSCITAQKVIVTLPPNIIARNITFEPKLSHAKERLYMNMVMGNMTKVFVVFKTSFWLKHGFSGEVVSTGGPTKASGCEKGPVTIFFDATTKLGVPALVGFIAGRNSDQWMMKTENEIKSAVLLQLESYFGPLAMTEYVRFYMKNWAEEPNLRGAPINYLGPGQMHNFHELRTPHGQNVHFAGTATSVEWCGYFSGAVQSGYRAVAEVIQDLYPDGLTREDVSLIKNAHVDRKIQPVWKHKYPSRGSFLKSGRFLLGLALGIAIMHPRFKVWERIASKMQSIMK